MPTPGQYTDNFLHTVYPDPGTIGDLATRDHVGMMLLTHEKALGKITSYPFRLQGGQGHAGKRPDSQFVTTADTTGLLAGGGGRAVVEIGSAACRERGQTRCVAVRLTK